MSTKKKNIYGKLTTKRKLARKAQTKKNTPVKDWEWRMDPPIGSKSKGRFVTYERNQGEGYTPEVLIEAQKIVAEREKAMQSAIKSAFHDDVKTPRNTKEVPGSSATISTETNLQNAHNQLLRTGEIISGMIKHLCEIGDRTLGPQPLNKVDEKDSGWTGFAYEINKQIEKNRDLLSTLDNLIYRLDCL